MTILILRYLFGKKLLKNHTESGSVKQVYSCTD